MPARKTGSTANDVPLCGAGADAAASPDVTGGFYFKPMGEGGLRPGVDLTDGGSVQRLLDEEEYAEHHH